MEDGVPEEKEIEWVVKRLQNNRAGGPSRMRAEDLKGWLVAAKRDGTDRSKRVKDGGEREGDAIDEGGATPHPRGVAPPSGVVQGNG